MMDLHDCIDKLLLLPFEQQALVRQCNYLLEGSFRLWDICSTAKIVFWNQRKAWVI